MLALVTGAGMVTQGADVRRCVLVFSSLFLTVQILALAATVVFYLYACSEAFKDVLAREIFTRLYPRTLWRTLRRNNALQVSTGTDALVITWIHLLFTSQYYDIL